MSKALIILTCPECGSENVTFDGNCTCYCNSCKCKYDVSMNTNVNYIDSLYDVELDDNIRLVKEFRSNGCQSKLLSMRCDDGKTYVNAILQNDGYMRAALDSYEIVRELLLKKHKDGNVSGFVPMMETYANSAVMRLYDNMEFLINEAITKWYSSNAVFLTLCEQREILRIDDIRTMALDAMCKSLYIAKSDFLEMLNTVVLNVETWMEIPEGYNELAKKNSRGRRYYDDDDYDY